MPHAAPSMCLEPGCSALVPRGRCDAHRREYRRETDAGRPNATDRGYASAAWRKTRADFLRAHPYCEDDECAATPIWLRPFATDVDHIDGLGPLGPRGHDWTNLSALCHPHHSRKTALHDGGFGHSSTDDGDDTA